MSSNQAFVLKYVLPSGTIVGYHLDTSCHMGRKKLAKVYRGNPEEQIRTVQKSFNWVWKNSEEPYRTQPAWEGAKLEDIKIVAEVV